MNRLLRTSLLVSAGSALFGALLSSACGGANNTGFIGGDAGAGALNGTGGKLIGTGGTIAGSGGTENGGEGGGGNVTKPCEGAADCPASAPVCHSTRSTCVECETAADCDEAGAQCDSGVCVVQTPCATLSDCPGSLLCDETAGFCVECLTTPDCVDDAKVCVGNSCQLSCASDVTCKGSGLRCDTNQGFCVECLSNTDCDENEFCEAGSCQADVCMAGSTACQSDAVHQCNEDGSAFPSVQTCSDGCEVVDGNAQCKVPVVLSGCANAAMIDDMEDGNTSVCTTADRNGSYFYRKDGSYTTVTPLDPGVELLPTPRGTSTYAAHFGGQTTASSTWGALLGMRFKTLGGTVDASQYSGITFWAKGSGSAALKAQVQDVALATSTDGGSCVDSPAGTCNGFHETSIGLLSSTWTQYTITFANLTQPVWALNKGPINKSQLTAVTFWAPQGSGTFDVWIDDVQFVP